MYRACLEVEPATQGSNADFLIELLYCCVRNKLDATYPDLWKHISTNLDRALETSYTMMQGSKITPSTWLMVHEPYIGAVLDKNAMTMCIHQKSNWEDVSTELAEVCKSAVGFRIFEKRCRAMAGPRLSNMIND